MLPPAYAAILGDQLRFAAHAVIDDKIVVDHFALTAAAGAINGDAVIAGSDVAANLHGEIADLARFQGLLGERIEGSAALDATVRGARDRPEIEAQFSAERVRLRGSGIGHITAKIAAKPEARGKVALSGSGRVEGLATPGVPLPPSLGHDIDWSFAAVAARDLGNAELTRLSVEGAGLDISASGQMADRGRTVTGRAEITIADLRPFAGLAGYPIAGAATLAITAERRGDAGFEATIKGSGTGIETGVAAADALLGGSVALDAALGRNAAGVFAFDRLKLAAGHISVAATGKFDPAADRLDAAGDIDLPQLAPLGPALGVELAGALSAKFETQGSLDHLRLGAGIDGRDVAVAGARIDRLRVDAQIPDLATQKLSAEGNFAASGLDGAVTLAAERSGSELVVSQMRLAAAGAAVEGGLRVGLDTGLVSGSLAGRIPDLARWSALAETPLAGAVEMRAGLDARGGGQALELTASGRGLAVGAGSSRLSIGRFETNASLVDLLRRPTGSGRLSLAAASAGMIDLKSANLTFTSLGPGRFGLRGEASGKPLTTGFAGEAGIENGGVDLRLDRFAGTLDGTQYRLEQPLTVMRRADEFAFADLALRFGTGRVGGNGAIRGERLALDLRGDRLPLAAGARLLGASGMHGALSFTVRAEGTLAAPRGSLNADLRDFGFGAIGRARQSLGLTASATWNGRTIDAQGRVTGLEGDRIAFTGSAPLVLNRNPLGLSAPPQGRVAMRIEGGGRLDHFADLLPLGEDRLSGKFAVDLTVGGTVANPDAGGRVTLSDARYQNFATGAVLTGMQATIVGNRDRLNVVSLTAQDGASGKLQAQGMVALAGASGPSLDLSARLDDFRLAARDEALVTASGRVRVTGPVSGPTVATRMTVNRADISLPERLPPTVVVLDVVEINSRTGKRAPPPASEPAAPALPAKLDITLDMPGRVFVRGHGLESEWRGRLVIAGTSAAPRISGSLEAIRGTFDLLGKSFRLTQSTITFDGGAKLDPVLDIVAEVTAGGVTAQARISGLLSSPTVSLTSTPALPQDEVLSRVLFGRGVGQITAAEGLQLAQAAAALSGRGPDVLSRLRTGLGLDWLRFGSGPVGVARSILNPNSTGFGNGRECCQRRKIHRRGRLGRHQPGRLAADQQGDGRNPIDPTRHIADRSRPEQRRRHRPQLQFRLLRRRREITPA